MSRVIREVYNKFMIAVTTVVAVIFNRYVDKMAQQFFLSFSVCNVAIIFYASSASNFN